MTTREDPHALSHETLIPARWTDCSSRGSLQREFRGMQLDEVVHTDWLLACELEQIVGHTVVPALLVQLRHHGEVFDDVHWDARVQKLFAPAGARYEPRR
jgi:hypothetical protein